MNRAKTAASAVAMVMALMVWLWKWDKILRPDHFDAIGRLLIIVATTWFFFFIVEFFFAIYTKEAPELALRELQIFNWPYAFLFLIFIITAYFLPVPLWMFKKVRRNVKWMFWTTVSVNVGMWLERFLIFVPSLARKTPLEFNWGTYHPSIIEMLMVAATFAWVAMGMLLFSKFFPLIPKWEEKEGQKLMDDVQVGNVKVPAMVKED